MLKVMLKALVASLTAVAAVCLVGCGGGKANTGSLVKNGAMGSLILTIDWGKSRLIPPETVKVDVTISGDGLTNPLRDSISRPQNQTTVTKVYTLPVGFKRVTVEAKDSNNRTVASGQGTTVLVENQRADLEIVLQEVTGPATVLVRTLLNNQPTKPLFIAYQDGDGNWQVPQGNGEYTLTINDPQGRYGVAIVRREGDVTIVHARQSELPEINFALDETEGTRVTVSGQVSGLGTNELAVVSIGSSSGFAYSIFPNYQVAVEPGTYDLVAVKGTGSTVTVLTVNKVLIRRNINISGNTTINIDFSSGEAFDPENRLGSVGGLLPSESLSVLLQFLTQNRTTAWLFARGGDANFQLPCIPANRQQPDELHQLLVTANDEGAQSYRSILMLFKAPTDISVSLPSPLGDVQISANITSPYVRFTTSWQPYAGAMAYNGNFQEGLKEWSFYLTAEWLGEQTSYTLPDFSGLSGWNNDWGISSTGAKWNFAAIASNRTVREIADFLLKGQALDGLEVRIAGKGLFQGGVTQ